MSAIDLTLVGSTSTVSEATSSPTSKADPYPIVNLLKVDRDAGRLTYIPHTVEQKNIVLTNIENALQLVEGSKDIVNEPVVIVTSRSTDPVELKLFGPDYSKISSGDFLHSLDGLSFAKWFDKYQSILGLGANVFAGHRYALDALNGVGGKYQALPTNNEITFQFKSSKDGTIYTVVVPHLSFTVKIVGQCLAIYTKSHWSHPSWNSSAPCLFYRSGGTHQKK
ncbi:hypothetical protein BASA83_010892 [Batrachochytrium salamandrivorans]|nr:hypothetical protein BASA83_010892 [Batrachochytrium salamandrivorans]